MCARVNYKFFLKFGQRIHLEEFQKGKIYMNSLSWFANQPEENFIGDRLEGLRGVKSIPEPSFFKLRAKDKEFHFKSVGPSLLYPNRRYQGNIFCLYGGSEDLLEKYLFGLRGKLPIQDSFGKSEAFALINKPRLLIEKIVDYCKDNAYEVSYNRVDYKDYSKIDTALTPFCKRHKYSHQHEFRIYIKKNEDGPLILDIGDISDFCHIGYTKHHQNIEFRVK
ncbi:hypothetical protein [Sphingobacterium corticibacter]|uniref:Uncharacterized protein n=1 Tax=Sphingobacterium corticibacter TaxID=2171749 RepID=A0A2T8HLI7_9SPHI|nr:hypothetical protein [Sphingobacterium corticibacter]PVH26308.1 hypothetical protein DC487_01385 [Sphingobacterium corticibacter]